MTARAFPNLHRSIPPTPELTVGEILEQHLKMLMTDDNCAGLRGLLQDKGVGPVRFARRFGFAAVGYVGPDTFLRLVGREPLDDDLERINCTEAGTPGHGRCGWCDEHELPRWECGCFAPAPTDDQDN